MSTPVIVRVDEPAPETWAPIWLSMSHRSTTSGSRAALWIVVTPSARTAAIRMFSVAPTDGNSSWISAPCSESASATTHPCSMLQSAPSCRRPA